MRAVSSPSIWRRAPMATCAPSRANASAAARPMPELPPVMTAILPSSSGFIYFVSGARFGRYILPPAAALIMRAIFHSIGRLDLHVPLFGVERQAGLVSRRNLFVGAVAEGDLFSRHKHHLPDRHVV